MQIQILQRTREKPHELSAVATLTLEPVAVSVESLETGPVLEWLFRQFNAVDGSELFSLLPVRMASLSVGDRVVFSDGGEHSGNPKVTRTFECEGCGWREVHLPTGPTREQILAAFQEWATKTYGVPAGEKLARLAAQTAKVEMGGRYVYLCTEQTAWTDDTYTWDPTDIKDAPPVKRCTDVHYYAAPGISGCFTRRVYSIGD